MPKLNSTIGRNRVTNLSSIVLGPEAPIQEPTTAPPSTQPPKTPAKPFTSPSPDSEPTHSPSRDPDDDYPTCRLAHPVRSGTLDASSWTPE